VRPSRYLGLLAVTALVAAAMAGVPANAAPAPAIHFGAPVYVDGSLAGGEPFVLEDARTHRLVYTSHEGTTHLYRPGMASGAVGDAEFLANYRNQVNIWTSADHGRSWQRVSLLGSGFINNPADNTGFSDPDLTEDAGGRIYDTGIDLANDALFSSADGGRTWPTGTAQCHEGDRPWLAGGRRGEVFLSTDSETAGHIVVRSADGGASCGSTAAVANGAGWTGDGKLYYDRLNGALVEPAVFSSGGVGIDVLPHASTAFGASAHPRFTGYPADSQTAMFAHWPSIAIDSAGTIYLVWDTNEGSARPNSIMLTYTRDLGRHWAVPIQVARPGTTVLWPWVTAGSAGNVGVVYYQYDRLVSPDSTTVGNVHVMVANLYGVTGGHRVERITDAAGRTIHVGGICQGGTTCVATGQDRRLGDLLTDSIDDQGCVMVATGDTMQVDPVTKQQLPVSHPLFLIQTAGRSLTGRDCAKR